MKQTSRLWQIFLGVALLIASAVGSAAHATAWDLSEYMALRQAPLSSSQRRLASSLRAMAAMMQQRGAPAVRRLLPGAVRLNNEGVIDVYVYTDVLTQAEIDILQHHSVRLYRAEPQFHIVYAAVAIEALETIAAFPFVRWVSLPSYSMLRTGSVTSEGDTVLRAAEARRTFQVNGHGVRVGVISDSLLDLQASVDSGDLPPDVIVLEAGGGFDTDEGRALAEIIHDMAPGATLLFHSGVPTSVEMIQAIRNLVDAGAQVIVDDIGFLDEPVFEEGIVAQTVQDAIEQGVVYVTATGNDATQHYRAMYREFDPNDGDLENNFHDFGQGDSTMAVAINPGERFFAVLQWANRFDGSANTANYDLLVFDANGRASACNQSGISGDCISADNQLAGRIPPKEVVFVSNTTSRTITVTLLINRVAGPALPLVLNFNFDRAGRLLEHNVPSGSVFGHPCVPEAIAVGAIRASDTGFDTIESFSSRGPCELFFPRFTTHTKPDVVAADGVQTSLSRFRPFFGTSAAAPHVAGIVALLIDAAGGPGMLSNTQLANIIRLSARDRGEPEHDNTFGHGAVDAVTAVRAVQELLADKNSPPQSTIEAPADDLVVVPGASVLFQGTCTDVENDGPFTVTWDFGDNQESNLQNPEMVFPNPGVFPVTFTCVDADGVSDPSLPPTTRTITVNRTPGSTILAPASNSTVSAGSGVDFTGACDDTEGDTPFTFLWFFGGGADMASSTQQNPRNVQFSTAGTFVVTFFCTDALGSIDLQPATVQIRVIAGVGMGGGGGGGGGGCTMLSGSPQISVPGMAGYGNILLPVITLFVLRAWSYYRRRR